MLNIKETIYIWCAIIGIVTGCVFSYGISSLVFESLNGDDFSNQGANALFAVGNVKSMTRQDILEEIISADSQILSLQLRKEILELELASIREDVADR